MEKLNCKIVEKYSDLQGNIKEVLRNNGVTQKHIYSKIGMPRSTWNKKINNKEFSIEEMRKICNVINR